MAFGIRPFFDGLRRMLSRRILPTSLGSRDTDPGFENVSNSYRLTVGGGAVNTATNLSVRFSSDIVGATRPALWDIGAYEYLGRRATAGTVNVGTLIITP